MVYTGVMSDVHAILKRLETALNSTTLAHAYLFSGPRGAGKTVAARGIAARVLQTLPEKLITHPDFYVLERGGDDKEISIDEVRLLRQRLSLTAAHGGYKVALIERVELLAQEAASALLKTLEEPPGRALIMMTTDRYGAVLPTIRSRAVRMAFPPPQAMPGARPVLLGMPQELTEEIEKLFKTISDAPYGLRCKAAESFAKSIERRTALLAQAASFLHRGLFDAVSEGKSFAGIAARIRALVRTDALLTYTNTNSRLALEVFLMQL